MSCELPRRLRTLSLAKLCIAVTMNRIMTPFEEQMLGTLATTLDERGVEDSLVTSLREMYEADRLPTADVLAQAIRGAIEETSCDSA